MIVVQTYVKIVYTLIVEIGAVPLNRSWLAARFKLVEFHFRLMLFYACECLDPVPFREHPCSLVPKAYDHSLV